MKNIHGREDGRVSARISIALTHLSQTISDDKQYQLELPAETRMLKNIARHQSDP